MRNVSSRAPRTLGIRAMGGDGEDARARGGVSDLGIWRDVDRVRCRRRRCRTMRYGERQEMWSERPKVGSEVRKRERREEERKERARRVRTRGGLSEWKD